MSIGMLSIQVPVSETEAKAIRDKHLMIIAYDPRERVSFIEDMALIEDFLGTVRDPGAWRAFRRATAFLERAKTIEPRRDEA